MLPLGGGDVVITWKLCGSTKLVVVHLQAHELLAFGFKWNIGVWVRHWLGASSSQI